jgi:excisionase family DNA binding protein
VSDLIDGPRSPSAEWLSLGPASRVLGIDPDTLRRWADAGRVRSFATPGGHRRFALTDLNRLQQARRSTRRPLATLGATPERLARAYARSYRSGPPLPAAQMPGGVERDVFRAEGRRLIEALVAYLDSSTAATKTAAESEARTVIESTARRLAAGRADLLTAIAAFVAARRPFLDELESIGRRRSLEAAAVMGLYAETGALLDRLLLSFVATFQSSSRQAEVPR